MLTKVLCVQTEALQCFPMSNKLSPLLLNKEFIIGVYKLLHKSYKKFYAQQSIDDARQTRKYLQKNVLLSEGELAQKTLVALTVDFKTQSDILNDSPSKMDKRMALLEIAEINRQVSLMINESLASIAVNDYERSVAIYLATQYRHQEVLLNVALTRHDKHVKEFDAIVRGDSNVLVEEKVTLDKHNLKNIFDCTPERKASHLRILQDALIQEQNGLPRFEVIHLIFSDIDERLVDSPRRKVLRLLEDTMSLELSPSKFVDLFDGDITLHKAKQTSHNVGLKKIILTRLDQERIHPNRWSILG